MPITAAEIKNIISADDSQFTAAAARVQSSLVNMTSQFGGFNQATAKSFTDLSVSILGITPLMAGLVVVGAAAAGAIAKAAFDAAVAFDEASDKIRISTGAVGEELTQLEGSFKTVFTSIPTSSEDASKAIAFLNARLHETGPSLERLATTELELARITGSALAPQLEATTRLFKDWEISTNAQTQSLDFLFKVGQKTAIGVTDLSQKLVQFGAPLRNMGFSFEQAAILIGKFQAEGVELNKALPGLRIALTRMAKEGVTDAGAAFQYLTEKIIAAKTPMEAIRLAVQTFGAKAGPDMAEAIRQGRFSIEELTKTIANSRDTIRGAGKDTEDFAEKWIILKNKATAAIEPLGKIVFDGLTLVISYFTDTSEQITKQWDKLWNDLGLGAEDGIGALIDKIANKLVEANGQMQQAGANLMAALGRGITQGFDSAVKGMLGIEGPKIIPPAQASWKDAYKGLRDESEKTWKILGGHAVEGTNRLRSIVGGGGHAAGHAGGKALLDGFKEGAAGLDQAISLIFSKQSGLSNLFDPITKSARAGAQETVAALKVVGTSLTDFFTAAGTKVKISAEQIAANLEKFKPSIALADAFAHLKEAINNVNVDRVVAGLAIFDDSIKVIGRTIEISIPTLEALRAKFPLIVEAALKAGFVFKSVFPEMSVNVNQFSDAINKAGDDVMVSLTQDATIMKEWSVTATQAFEKVMDAAPHWAGAVVDAAKRVRTAMENDASLAMAEASLDMAASGRRMVETFLALGEQANLTGDELLRFVRDKLSKLPPELAAVGAEAYRRFTQELFKLPGALDEIFNKMAVGAKQKLSGLFQVIDSMPGKFGDSLRRTTSEVTKWIDQIDGLLKGLNKLFGDAIPAGLGEALSKVFKKTSVDIKTATDQVDEASGEWSEKLPATMSKAASGVESGAARMVGAFTQIAGAALAFVGAKGQGFAGGALSGALGGIAAAGGIATALGLALSPLTLGLSALGGALLGGIIGLFTGGKSALQKAQEAAALQKAKDDIKLSMDQVLKSAQEVIQSGIETFNKALDFFNKLDEFSPVRKDKFKAFFAQLSKMMDFFVELAGKWSSDSLAKAKIAAEAIAPVADALAKLPLVFEGMSKHMEVPNKAFKAFFRDFARLMDRFFVEIEEWADGQAKHAGKLAEQIAPVINIFGPLIEVLKGMANIEEPSKAAFHAVFRTLERIVARITEMAQEFDGAGVKGAQKFSQSAQDIVGLIGAGVTALVQLGTFTGVSQINIVAFGDALALSIAEIIAVAETLDEKGVEAAKRFSDSAGGVVQLIGSAIGNFSKLSEVAAIPSSVFASLKANIQNAIQAVIEVAQSMNIEGVNAAALFSESATKVVNFLSAVSGTLKALDNVFAVAFDFGFVKNASKAMIEMIIDLAKEMGTEGVSAASAFATASGAVVGFMSSIANAFKSLKEAGAVTVGMVDGLASGFALFVTKLSLMARDLGPDAIAAAVVLAQQVNVILDAVSHIASTLNAIAGLAMASNGIVDFMSGVAAALSSLKDIGAITGSMIEGAVAVFGQFVTNLALMAKQLGPAAISEAVAIAQQLTTVLDTVTRILSTMTAIATTRWPAQSAWDSFVQAISQMVVALQRSLTMMTQGQSLAEQMQQAATAIASGVASAASSLGSVAGLSAPPSSATFGPQSFASSSALAPSSALSSGTFAPSSFSQQSQAASNVTVNVNVNGTVIGNAAAVEDAVFRALERGGRRGRLRGMATV